MPEINSFDNDYRILYSQTVNIYSSKLIIKKIYWFDFTFDFQKDDSTTEAGININSNDDSKTIVVNLKNFSSPLWVWTTVPIQILTLSPEDSPNENAVYFSIFARSLNELTSYLQVTITFYAK
jgi:hypothetical protein